MRCKRCSASTWRPHGHRIRTSTGTRIRRRRCASCGRIQDEDAENPRHGLRRGARRSSRGGDRFTVFWSTVANLLPRAPLQQALTRACGLTGLHRTTPLRWVKSESRRRGILTVPESADAVSILEDCLALSTDGLSPRIDRGAALLSQNTPFRTISAVAEEWDVAEWELKELLVRAHEVAVDGFREPAIVSVDDLEERSRRGAMVLVHKRRARLPVPVYLLMPERSFRCLSAWSVLAGRGDELEYSAIPEEEEKSSFLVPTGELLEETLEAAVEGDTDHQFGDEFSLDQEQQMLRHAHREWVEAIDLQLRADAFGTDRVTGKDVGPGDPFGDDRLWMRFRFCPPTFVSLTADALTVEVVRGGRLDGRATDSVPAQEGGGRPAPGTGQSVRLDVVGSVTSSFLALFE